jgi:hypothetical protein
MRQYHLDFWAALYKSPEEFKGKEAERARQREADEEDDDNQSESDDEGGRHGPRTQKRKRTTIKNAKAVKKTFDRPPGLTYLSVKAELEEEPIPAGMGKAYSNRSDLFDLIFQSEYEEITGQGWRDKPYLHCVQLLRRRLGSKEYNVIIRRLRSLFAMACHCIHVVSRDRWLERLGRDKSKPGWIAFDVNGNRLDCSSSKSVLALRDGSSWLETRSMEDDKYWNMPIDDILNM